MSLTVFLLSAASFSALLGALLVARTVMATDTKGRMVGLVFLGLTMLFTLAGFAPGAQPQLPWSLGTVVIALACGFTLGFGVFRNRAPAGRLAPSAAPTPSALPALERRWVTRVMALILLVRGLLFCVELGQGSPPVLTGAAALLFLGLGAQLLPGPLRLKGVVIGGLAPLAVGVGRLMPPGMG